MHIHIKKTALRLLGLLRQNDLTGLQESLDRLGDHTRDVLEWPGTEKHPPLLFSAVKAGNSSAVNLLLERGASLEVTDHQGRTPLYQAFSGKHFDIVQQLVDAGASWHHSNQFGTRVLDLVVFSGSVAWLDFCLQQGMVLDHRNQHGMTPLHWAAQSGSTEMLEKVLQHTRLPLDAVTTDGHAPLHHASTLRVFEALRKLQPDLRLDLPFGNGTHFLHRVAQHGEVLLMQHLLDLGLDIEAQDSHKSTPLFYAVSSNRVDMVKALLQGNAKVNARNRPNYRPLHWAAERGFLEVARVLLDHGAKPNVKLNRTFIIQETHTPLYLAVSEGHLEMAQLLLEAGADVNALNDASNTTALCEAARHNDLEMMQLLLQHGALPRGIARPKEHTFEYFNFPLACVRSRAAVELLVFHGADVNEQNRWQDTALHTLVQHLEQKDLRSPLGQDKLEAMDALLSHGASVHTTNWHGRKPLADARCKEVSALLAQAAQGQQTAPLSAVQQERQQEQQQYFALVGSPATMLQTEEESAPDLPASLGPELLSLAQNAYTAAELDALEAVLQHATPEDVGFIANDTLGNLDTPLHRVLRRMHHYGKGHHVPPLSQFQRVIEQMVAKGAPLNHRETLYGDTPLHKLVRASATHYSSEADLQVFRDLLDLLLAHGADASIRNADGNTPLDFANQPVILKHLQDRGAPAGSHHIALFDAIEYHNPQAFERCLALKVPLEGRNRKGHTALMHATVQNRAEMIGQLVEHGAKVQARTKEKQTLLHLACQKGAFEALEHLLDHLPIDVNAQDVHGDTAVKVLLEGEWNLGTAQETRARIVALVLQLVKAGADLQLKNKQGKTPLDCSSTRVLATEVQKALRKPG